MGFRKGQNPNHPRKGASIKADPVRDVEMIAKIKYSLDAQGQERNLCLFIVAINTAWRANELLSVRIRDVQLFESEGRLELKQSKTGNYRITPLNGAACQALRRWLDVYQKEYPYRFRPNAPLFPSRRGGGVLLVSSLSKMVKGWCRVAGAPGSFSSHTLRKTWAYHQRVTFGEPVPLISRALGHVSEAETLAYIGILPQEVNRLYSNEL